MNERAPHALVSFSTLGRIVEGSASRPMLEACRLALSALLLSLAVWFRGRGSEALSVPPRPPTIRSNDTGGKNYTLRRGSSDHHRTITGGQRTARRTG